MTEMTVDYDCGWSVTIPLVIDESSSILHNASLGDQMILMADATHDYECTECLEAK